MPARYPSASVLIGIALAGVAVPAAAGTPVLEADRVKLEQVSITDYRRLPEILDQFASRIETLGPNPYKGF